MENNYSNIEKELEIIKMIVIGVMVFGFTVISVNAVIYYAKDNQPDKNASQVINKIVTDCDTDKNCCISKRHY